MRLLASNTFAVACCGLDVESQRLSEQERVGFSNSKVFFSSSISLLFWDFSDRATKHQVSFSAIKSVNIHIMVKLSLSVEYQIWHYALCWSYKIFRSLKTLFTLTEYSTPETDSESDRESEIEKIMQKWFVRMNSWFMKTVGGFWSNGFSLHF